MAHGTDTRHARSVERWELVLQLVEQGFGISEALADPRVAVSFDGYRKWRSRNPQWSAKIDIARAQHYRHDRKLEDMTSAQFAFRYFRRIRQPFQQMWIDKVENLRPGNILLALWPPEYGKTTTFEDYATEKICRNPHWRNTTASEADTISKRIIGRVRNRLEPWGPYPQLIKDWGPFRPQVGASESTRTTQPWNNAHFTVVGANASDERDHTMLAIGWTSSTVSIRTDHLHIDDLQSLKTLGRTDSQLDWLRQDALSRPGETGVTSMAMTRVGDNDIAEALIEDEELEGILEVVRFPAIWYDTNGQPHPLWPEKHDLDQLDRIRRKVKDEAFDRNYMMEPGRSRTKKTFSEAGWARATLPSRKLNEPDKWREDRPKPVIVGSSDPALSPGKATFGLWVMTEQTMRLAYFNESAEFMRNEEIMAQYRAGFRWAAPHYVIKHLTVEANNFQKGLARDERLTELLKSYGVAAAEHTTGLNKYDDSIGIASMAGDWEAGKILLPYGDDDFTRTEIDEFHKQFKAWKPGKKGSELRQDRVMMTWFAWIWWVNNRHRLEEKVTSIKRQGLPYAPTGMRPIIPIGAKI